MELRETVRREKILKMEEWEQVLDRQHRHYLEERQVNTEGLSRVKLREITNLLRQEERVEFWTGARFPGPAEDVVTFAASSNTQSNWQRNFDPKPTPESHPPGAGHRQAAYQPSQNASRSEPTCVFCGRPGMHQTASGLMCGIHLHHLM